MTVVNIEPVSLKDAILQVEDSDYSTSVGQVTFTPSAQWEWMRRWDNAAEPVLTGITWTVTISYAQDIETPMSLTQYLLEEFGNARTMTFYNRDGGRAVQASVLCIPGQLGGVPGQPLSATVTLPLFGSPALGEWEAA